MLAEGRTLDTRRHTVTEADVLAFAELTRDRHPQHVDPAWARTSDFGEQIAHGMLVASLAVGLLDLPPDDVVALRRLRDVAFKRPVRLDAEIRVRARVARTREAGEGRGLATLAFEVLDEDDRTAVRGELDALVRTPDGNGTEAQR